MSVNDRNAVGANKVNQALVNQNGIVDLALKDERAMPDDLRPPKSRIPIHNTSYEAEYEIVTGELVVASKLRRLTAQSSGEKAAMVVSSFAGAPMYSDNIEDVLDTCIPIGIAFRDANFEQNTRDHIAQRIFSILVSGSFSVMNPTRDLPIGCNLRYTLETTKAGKMGGGAQNRKQKLVPVPEIDSAPFAMRMYRKYRSHYHRTPGAEDPTFNGRHTEFAKSLEDLVMLAFTAGVAAQANTGVIGATFASMYPGMTLDMNEARYLFEEVGQTAAVKNQAKAQREFIMRFLFPENGKDRIDERFVLSAVGARTADPTMKRVFIEKQMDVMQRIFECFGDCVRADNAYVFGRMLEGVPSGHIGLAMV